MGLQMDKFTWAVIAIVALLLIAAVVSVNMAGESPRDQPVYLDEDTPAAPVYNAFLALQEGDLPKARSYYSTQVLAEFKQSPDYRPLDGYSTRQARRLRITEIHVDETDPDQASVTFVMDTYHDSGILSSSSSYSYERSVDVVREDGAWKLNASEFFY
jgi:hypothetical protein